MITHILGDIFVFKCSLSDNQPRSDCPLVYLNSLIESNPRILNVQLIEFSVHFSQTINVHFFVKRIIFPGNLNLFKFLIGYSFPSSQIIYLFLCLFDVFVLYILSSIPFYGWVNSQVDFWYPRHWPRLVQYFSSLLFIFAIYISKYEI